MPSILNSPDAVRYAETAKAFVDLVDSRRLREPVEWVAAVHRMLPVIYAAALALEEIEPDSEDPKCSVTSHSEWKAVYDDSVARLGRWNYYWDVYDPYSDTDREAVCGSLADDIADIYRDLRDGLAAVAANGDEHPNDVYWMWRFDFSSHWAAHAVGALRALATAVHVHRAGEHPEAFGPEASIDPAPPNPRCC